MKRPGTLKKNLKFLFIYPKPGSLNKKILLNKRNLEYFHIAKNLAHSKKKIFFNSHPKPDSPIVKIFT